MLWPNCDERLTHGQIVIATLWPVATCVAWLWSTRWASLQGHYEAALTGAALIALAMSWAVRYLCGAAGATPECRGDRPQVDSALRDESSATYVADATDAADAADSRRELVWLAAWLGQIFALGGIALLLPSLASWSPALFLTAVIEGCALNRAPIRWQRSCQALFGQLPPLHHARALATCDVQIRPQSFPISSADAEAGQCDRICSAEGLGARDSPESDSLACQRQSMEECSEDGQRSLSGWIRYRLEAGQRTLSIIVGFCPAFAQCPEVDVELLSEQADDLTNTEFQPDFTADSLSGLGVERSMNEEDRGACEAHIEHVTPAGMRVILKRRTATELSLGKLMWHATLTPAADSVEWLAARLKAQLP